MANEFEAIVPRQVGHVVGVARDEVVQRHDVMSLGKKAVAEMRAKEARPASDEDPHDLPPRPIEA